MSAEEIISSDTAEVPRCPVSGLPFITKPEWVNIEVDTNYSISVALIGNALLYLSINGAPTLKGTHEIIHAREKILKELGLWGKKYAEIRGYGKMTGRPQNEARILLTNLLLKETNAGNLLGFWVFDAPFYVRWMFNVGIHVHKPNAPISAVSDYETAVNNALAALEKNKVIVGDRKIEKKTQPDWEITKNNFSDRFELIGDDIVFNEIRGVLDEETINEHFRLQDKILREIGFSKEKPYYRIANWESLVKMTWNARKIYTARIGSLQKDFPCAVSVIYGLNKSMTMILGISRRFVKTPVFTVKNLTEALAFIRSKRSYENKSRIKPRQLKKKTYSQKEISQYSDELLELIGIINWEQAGTSWKNVSESHPFKPIFDAIAIIKGDLDDLMREQKENAAALKESISLLDASLESTADGILVVNKDQKISRWNQKFIDLWKVPAELLDPTRKDPVLEYVVGQMSQPEAFLSKVMELYEHPDEISFDLLYLTDGRIFERYSQPQKLGDNFVGRVWSFRDITKRKQAEDSLRAERDYSANILKSTPAVICGISPKGICTFVNPAGEEITGYAAEELIGSNWWKMLYPGNEYEQVEQLFRDFKKGPVKDYEMHHTRKDGTVRTVAWNSLNRLDKDGRLLEIIGFGHDITDRKLAEQSLLKATLAEEANQAKSEFLANMSHEIRTPMNGIIGMTGLLLDTELNNDQKRYAEIVRSSGESLLGLLNDILDFSKIEARKMDLEIMEFNLYDLMDDFIDTLALRAHDKGLELLYSIATNVPATMRGDPGRLRQVLANLAGNAVKFTGIGEVAIHVTMQSEADDTMMLRFEVRDTGIGIPNDKLNYIFNKFTQADASTTRHYGGTGLGLAICKQLSELMNGEVGVESDEGRGSRFWFTARLGKCIQKAEEKNQRPAPGLQDLHILIVDDNATNREMLMTRLGYWKMRPSTAADGPEALKMLLSAKQQLDPFRIALIDMQMPDMNGETLARAIRGSPDLDDTIMVLLTSMGSRGDAKRFEEMGFAAYMTKPLHHQELKNVLAMTLAIMNGDSSRKQAIVTRHSARNLENHFGGSRARILLAEDNITNQQVALGILAKLGLRADAVANGSEAIKALATLPYDLVLMDLQMPVMDGLEATRMIRAIEGSPSAVNKSDIPIIAMTANALRGDRETCIKAGMDDYITKPITPQSMAAMLETWLPRMPNRTIPNAGKTSSSGMQVWDKNGMLDRLMDDKPLAQKIIAGFLSDTPIQMAKLEEYVNSGDAGIIERQAHSIKSAAANVGGEILRETALEMEESAHRGDVIASRLLLPRIKAELQRLQDELQKPEIIFQEVLNENADCRR